MCRPHSNIYVPLCSHLPDKETATEQLGELRKVKSQITMVEVKLGLGLGHMDRCLVTSTILSPKSISRGYF
jgi:hypothetical protein